MIIFVSPKDSGSQQQTITISIFFYKHEEKLSTPVSSFSAVYDIMLEDGTAFGRQLQRYTQPA